MTDLEQRVTTLLAELAEARPVVDADVPRGPQLRARSGGASSGTAAEPNGEDPAYPTTPLHPRRRSARWVAAAAAMVAVSAIVGAVLLRPDAGGSPVSASVAQLQIDTAALAGGRMAVVVGNDLYVADGPTGQVWKLTDVDRGNEVSQVSFSHDGEWVAFSVHDESGLWVSRWDGSESHRVGRAPSTYEWSPTDDRLAYATADEVRVAEVDGSGRALAGVPDPQPYTNVVWSPEGDRIAFAEAPRDGAGAAFVVVSAADDSTVGAWSRHGLLDDGAHEVVAWPVTDAVLLAGRSEGGDGGMLWLADLPSTSTSPLLGFPGGSQVAVSDDGSTVAAHLTDRPSIERCELAEVDSATPCGPIWLEETPDRVSAPSFSPDAVSVAIVGPDADGRTVLTVAAAPGSGRPTLGVVGEGLALTDPPAQQSPYGSVIEPPQWIDDSRLLVRAGGRVVVVELDDGGAAVPATVVEGERFLAPEDDYPGGTGLDYWTPA